MAWVRRVRTASGATAVQIAESVGGRRRIVRHVGSARDEAELAALIAEAHRLMADDARGELDLGFTPVAPTAVLVPAPRQESPGEEPAPRRWVRRAHVLTTASTLLYESLAGVYDGLGYDAVGDDVFRDLVIAHVVEPTSLLDVDRVLTGLGRVSASHSTRKRTLRRAHAGEYRARIAAACAAHAANAGDVSLVLCNVATLYFEAEKNDDLRKIDAATERRADPQIVVGLLVDRAGFPLEIGCVEGTPPQAGGTPEAEAATIARIIEAFQARHGIADIVVVADTAMLSASHLRALDEAGVRFIVGSRTTKAPMDLESHFHRRAAEFRDAQIIETITPSDQREVAAMSSDPAVTTEPAWDPLAHAGSWRAVRVYSAKRAARDTKTLTRQETRALAVVAGGRSARSPRFVTTRNGEARLDEAALARARNLVGLKGYVTNIPAAVMPAGEVIAGYHDLWNVEQSIRMSTTDLVARPMFARTRDAIEAHLTIAFAALALSRTVQNRTGPSIRGFVRTLRPLHSATIEINGVISTVPPAIEPEIEAILTALERPAPRRSTA